MSHGSPAPSAGSLLVPLYVHPAVDPAAWQALEDAAPALYGVVLNAADGPGDRPDPVYTLAARRLREAGAPVLGYVDTDYAARPAHTVYRDLRRHRAWYATDGVFFDRVASDARRIPYYRWLARTARLCGARTVVFNPGVHPDPGYARLCDLLVTFEGTWDDYQGAGVPRWTAGHPAERFCHLVYGVPDGLAGRAARLAALRGAAVRCAVPGLPPNPWRTAPVPIGGNV
ncbi:spherulation-specific family 4 protein [Streptomyces sp. NPDC087422]|uniref:spherulation-specific family 4 protein n=1 Tax=Streptomyces sp. NPDC087422 TaxID=3365786 RepID=UPI0038245F26